MHRFLSDWLFLGVFFFIFFTPSLQSRETQKIPRILHWAHPDSSPLSKEEIKSIKSWQKLHPKWRFKLWTNAPCTLKSVEICKSAFLNSDLESLKKAILQKEGGIFIDIGLIGCKTLEKLSLTGTPFQTSDGHSIIGCRPNQVDAPRKTLPEGFILPDQIFTTQLFPSPFVGGCFRRFNTLPRLTDELRKIQAANAEAEITAKLLSKKFTKIKWFFFPTLLLCFLNCFLLIQTFSHLVSFFKSKRGCALLALLFLIGTFFAWERPPRSIKGNTNHYLSLFNFAQYTDKIPESDLKYLEIYRSLFDQKFLSLTQRENREQIPHLIHFIWGGPPFPETSIRNIVSWMECHPEWTFYFWTDDPNRPVPVKGMIKRLFSELLFSSPIRSYFEKAENWGEKSDLLRYEILSREGGLYVDHDVECLHSFAPLHTSVSFYASAEPLHNSALYNSHLTVSNCLIGSVPNHPILSDTLRLSFERWDLGSQMFPDQDKLSNLLRTLFRTFSPLDETIRSHISSEPCAVILPPALVFPKFLPNPPSKALGKTDYPLASHHWSSTWFKEFPEITSSIIPETIIFKISAFSKLYFRTFYFLIGLSVLLIVFHFLNSERLLHVQKYLISILRSPIVRRPTRTIRSLNSP